MKAINSRTQQLAADQSMIDGIAKNKTKLPSSFPVGSQTMTPDDLVKVFQGRITTAKAAMAADSARTAAIQVDRDERAKTQQTVSAFRHLLVAMFLRSSDVLGDFGLSAPKVAVKSAEAKAQAAAKARATRKLLGTKGSQQKKAALQAAGVVVSAAPPAQAVAPAGTPVASSAPPATAVAPKPAS